MQPRQTSRIPPIRLDPVARPLRDQRWCHHNASVPVRRQLALNAVTARPRLIAEPQLCPVLAELAGQPPQRCRRVGDPTILGLRLVGRFPLPRRRSRPYEHQVRHT